MYIKKIELENIKSFKKFTYELNKSDKPQGWHVILGDNGTGKSTFIRAAVVALMGPDEALKSRHVFSDWVRYEQEKAYVRLELIQNRKLDSWAGRGSQEEENIKYSVIIDKSGKINSPSKLKPDRHVWSGRKGWFSVSYGPFRRFSGGNNEYQKLFYSSPLLARHLSVFGEDVALTETLEWLKELRFKQLESNIIQESKLLEKIIAFINQDDFLPNNVKLKKVTSDGIVFNDSFNAEVNIESLSDGYRSILSMTLEIIRQMVNCYEVDDIFDDSNRTVKMPGVVFIDEIDVHLHPSWQRKVGTWFTQHFPEIQFIVSTHSPLICQSAENGSIWKLAGNLENDKGQRIEGEYYKRLIYGNILEALTSGAFGNSIERSDKAKELQERLANLNIKVQFDESLTAQEKKERRELQSIFGLSPELINKE